MRPANDAGRNEARPSIYRRRNSRICAISGLEKRGRRRGHELLRVSTRVAGLPGFHERQDEVVQRVELAAVESPPRASNCRSRRPSGRRRKESRRGWCAHPEARCRPPAPFARTLQLPGGAAARSAGAGRGPRLTQRHRREILIRESVRRIERQDPVERSRSRPGSGRRRRTRCRARSAPRRRSSAAPRGRGWRACCRRGSRRDRCRVGCGGRGPARPT